MLAHRAFQVTLLIMAIAVVACRPPAKEQVSETVKKELAALQSEKAVIEGKLGDIERSLENIRRSIESIQNALKNIQARLEAVEAVPPTTTVRSKPLPLVVSAILVAVVLLCLAFYLKLRRMRARDKSSRPAVEVSGESGTGPTEGQAPR